MKKVLLSSLVAVLSVSAFANDEAKTEAPAEVSAECKVVIESNDQMQYNIKEFTIKKDTCAEFTIELDHVGKLPAAAMGHNVVVTKAADVAAVAAEGAAIKPDHVKEGDERIFAHTKIIGGGEKDAVTFKTDALEKGGDYEFFCSYPGHFAIMKGKVIVE